MCGSSIGHQFVAIWLMMYIIYWSSGEVESATQGSLKFLKNDLLVIVGHIQLIFKVIVAV